MGKVKNYSSVNFWVLKILLSKDVVLGMSTGVIAIPKDLPCELSCMLLEHFYSITRIIAI